MTTAARLLVSASRAVIDFLEQFVVLFDERVVGLELQRLLVRRARLVQFSFVLVRDRQIIVRRRVRGINLRRALPAVDGLAPRAALRHGNAEFHLLLGVAAGVGRQRRDTQRQQAREKQRQKTHGRPKYSHGFIDAQALWQSTAYYGRASHVPAPRA